MAKPKEGRNRVVIENVEPQVNCGLFPIKRIVNDLVSVEADVFGDGHDHVRARLLWKQEGDTSWQQTEMLALGNDRWRGEFPVTQIGRYRYTLVGEIDHFETWQSDLKKRVAAEQDLAVPFATGALLLEQVQPRATKEDAAKLAAWAQKLRSAQRELPGARTPQRSHSHCRANSPQWSIVIPTLHSRPGTTASWRLLSTAKGRVFPPGMSSFPVPGQPLQESTVRCAT